MYIQWRFGLLVHPSLIENILLYYMKYDDLFRFIGTDFGQWVW